MYGTIIDRRVTQGWYGAAKLSTLANLPPTAITPT